VANDPVNPVLDGLRLLLAAQTPPQLSDGDLLRRFVVRRDEVAFAALVHRHGPMVWGVCRRVLGNADDADDACQAAFLILVRKAAAIRNQDSLAGWLHRVAHRLAKDLQAQRARRAAGPLPEEVADRVDGGAEPMWREVRAALDEELQQLPDHYRAPLLLCYLDGKTRDEAAQQLGWSLDVFRGRLERGREALRRRLVRRGLALSAALLAEALARSAASAWVPAGLVLTILKYGRRAARNSDPTADVPTPVAELTRRGLQSMTAVKKKTVLILFVTACLAGVVGYAVYRSATASPAQSWADSLPPEVVASRETVELSGQVLTPDGRPAVGADLHAVCLHDSPLNDGPPLAVTGEDGRFACHVPKGELARHLVVERPVHLVASKDGFGMAWRPAFDFLPVEERSRVGLSGRLGRGRGETTLRLVKDDAPLTGRVEDAAGRPAVGVTVRLELVWANEKNDLSGWLAAVARDQQFEATHKLLPLAVQGKGLGRFSATTDDEGRFRLPGVGTGRLACLQLSGPGVATATILARTQAGPRVEVANLGAFLYPQPYGCFGADFTLAASAARPIVGVVRDRDTGRPVSEAVVQSHQFAGTALQAVPILSTRTDTEGRYRLLGMPAGRGNMLLVRCPSDQPYLPMVGEIDTSEGEGPVTLDFKVRRGLWAEGRVTDADTGRPLAADVHYYGLSSNPHAATAVGFDFAPPVLYQTDAAGRFRVVVLPGRGVLAVGLHGQRYHFLGKSWVTQAGKNYLDGRATVAAPEDQLPGKRAMAVYRAHPALLSSSLYQQMSLIDPAEGAESVACDLKVSGTDTGRTETTP
jgi:RNA polymerase sigma factor (sigma-70 family)